MASISSNETKSPIPEDVESQKGPDVEVAGDVHFRTCSGYLKKLATGGVEMRGLEPVPVEKRNHTKYYNIFTLFGGSFLTLLP